MGYTTDFIGHIGILPPLNHWEQSYLAAFNMSRRCAAKASPYDVPANPAADMYDLDSPPAPRTPAETQAYNVAAEGQPGLWCGWSPGWVGNCLTHDGIEKSYQPVEWLKYLIEHFLQPGALAARSDLRHFEHFTFDHILDGVVAANRRDTAELFLIDVESNRVSKIVLRRGDPQPWEMTRLPYEQVIDHTSVRRVRVRPPARRQ